MPETLHLAGPLEPRDGWSADRCSVAGALAIVGKRSTLLLLREAFYGATRFEEFVRRTGLSEPSTSARLRELVDEGLLERVPYQDPGSRPRRGYALTGKGTEVLPVLLALMRWGDRWATPHGDGPLAVRHRGCGERVGVEVRCGAGHEVALGALDVEPAPRR